MLTIEELNIQLPAEFRFRAEALAKLTAEQLAHKLEDKKLRIESLSLPSISLDLQQTDKMISSQLAEAILVELQHRL